MYVKFLFPFDSDPYAANRARGLPRQRVQQATGCNVRKSIQTVITPRDMRFVAFNMYSAACYRPTLMDAQTATATNTNLTNDKSTGTAMKTLSQINGHEPQLRRLTLISSSRTASTTRMQAQGSPTHRQLSIETKRATANSGSIASRRGDLPALINAFSARQNHPAQTRDNEGAEVVHRPACIYECLCESLSGNLSDPYYLTVAVNSLSCAKQTAAQCAQVHHRAI